MAHSTITLHSGYHYTATWTKEGVTVTPVVTATPAVTSPRVTDVRVVAVQSFFKSLGQSRDEIADSLLGMEIKAIPRTGTKCALALATNLRFPGFKTHIGPAFTQVKDDHDAHIDSIGHTAPIIEFIAAFDALKYPDLVHPDYVAAAEGSFHSSYSCSWNNGVVPAEPPVVNVKLAAEKFMDSSELSFGFSTTSFAMGGVVKAPTEFGILTSYA